jgi:hypothetical protein
MKFFSLIMLALVASGCAAWKPASASAPVMELCSMPSGFQMAPAIEMARETLNNCPEKLDDVFISLLAVARHRPAPENAAAIQNLLKELVKQNKISEAYSRNLYRKYFSRSFVSIPDLRVHRLSGQSDAIKQDLKKELGLKRVGILEVCNDKDSYKHAEAEYARVSDLLDNLLLNDDYFKTEKR